MRAVLCACDISVRVGVHFWDVQLRAACGAPGSTPRDRHVGPSRLATHMRRSSK